MIVSVGVDLVELKRVKEVFDERFIKRILSDSEHAFYKTITDPLRRLTFLGGRFAAKEALFKVFPTSHGTANYRDFSVINDDTGKPFVETMHLLEGYRIHLSISHTDAHAMAFVVLEWVSHNSP
jgi:holo-[acyl-carrier protein] synthase